MAEKSFLDFVVGIVQIHCNGDTPRIQPFQRRHLINLIDSISRDTQQRAFWQGRLGRFLPGRHTLGQDYKERIAAQGLESLTDNELIAVLMRPNLLDGLALNKPAGMHFQPS